MLSWECMFVHDELQLLLSIYVDDFNMVGVTQNLKAGWKTLTENGLGLDPPTPLSDYLGVGQKMIEMSPAEAELRIESVRDALPERGDKS